jgi:MFS transporter, OFA family, oxalate/formate antiporter
VIERSPVFYGWVILGVGTLGIMSTLPGQTVGVSVFLDHIIADLGLSRSLVSSLYLVGTLVGSLALPWVGRFIDVRGPRLTVTLVAAAFAAACVWMGWVREAVTLAIGFTLIRMLGQGSLSLVSFHVINVWFVRRRGLAVGVAGVGMATATALFPIAAEFLITELGWRTAYMTLGGIIAVAFLPLGAMLYRGHPERFGMTPDRAAAPDRAATGAAEPSYTLADARKTLTFWMFTVGTLLGACFGTGLVFHHYSLMAEGGVDRLAAAAAFVPYGVVSAATHLVSGYLMDRISPRVLLGFMTFFLGSAMVMATLVAGPASLMVYGVVLGMRTGTQGALSGSVMAYYFGRTHIGAIKGALTTILVMGSAFGPLLFSLGRDLWGSYTPILLGTAVPTLAFALAVPFVKLRRGGRLR